MSNLAEYGNLEKFFNPESEVLWQIRNSGEMPKYKKVSLPLGESDIASLVLRGMDKTSELKLSCDGDYSAWIIENDEAPEHYYKTFECTGWLWIYDDFERTLKVSAPKIEVYRSGEMGILIRMLEK